MCFSHSASYSTGRGCHGGGGGGGRPAGPTGSSDREQTLGRPCVRRGHHLGSLEHQELPTLMEWVLPQTHVLPSSSQRPPRCGHPCRPQARGETEAQRVTCPRPLMCVAEQSWSPVLGPHVWLKGGRGGGSESPVRGGGFTQTSWVTPTGPTLAKSQPHAEKQGQWCLENSGCWSVWTSWDLALMFRAVSQGTSLLV